MKIKRRTHIVSGKTNMVKTVVGHQNAFWPQQQDMRGSNLQEND